MDKDVLDMTLIERMVAAGMSRECAAETAMWYMAQGDDYGLEKYLNEVESRHANNGEVFLAQRKPLQQECGRLHS